MLKVADLFANLSLVMKDFNKGLTDAVKQAQSAGRDMGSAMSSSTAAGLNKMTQDVNAFANNARSQFKDVSRIVQGIVVSQAFYAGLNKVQSMVAAMQDYNISVEQSTVAFKYLLGSQEASVYMMNQLQDLASETSFTTDSAVKAGRLMMAYGYSAKETIPILRTMADASAVAGGDDDAFKRAIVAIGQMRAAGTVMKQDLNQLTNAGIPAIQILKEELKLTDAQMKEIGRQKIDSGTAVDALMRGLRKRYAGASKEMESTVGGLMNRIKDMALVIGNIFTLPSFEGFKKFLTGIANRLEHLRNVARQFGKEGLIAEIFGPEMVAPMKLLAVNISMLLQSLGQLRQAVSPVMREFINAFAIGLNAAMPIISGVIRALAWLTSTITQCTPAVRFFTFAIVGLMIASIVSKAVTALTGAIKAMAVADIVATLVVRLASAIKILWAAITRNPIGAVITLAAAALLTLALSSKTASAWLDTLTAKLGRLFGFDLEEMWKPLDPSDVQKGINDFNDSLGAAAGAAGEAGDAVDKVGDKAEEAGDKGSEAAKKMAKSFIAAFDEVFQVPEEDDKDDKGKDDKPDKGDGKPGGGNSLLPPIKDFEYPEITVPKLPELKWPEIPPFIWPPIPPFPPIPAFPPIPLPTWLPWAAFPPLPAFNPGAVPTPGWQPWPALPPVPVPQFPPVRLPEWGAWPQLPALPPIPHLPPIKMPSFPPWPSLPALPKIPDFPPLRLPTPNFEAWGVSVRNGVESALEKGRSICVDFPAQVYAAVAPTGQAVYNGLAGVGNYVVQGLSSLPSTISNNAKELYTQGLNLGEGIRNGISEGISTVQGAMAPHLENIKSKTSSAWESIKSGTASAWENTKSSVSGAVQGMMDDSQLIPDGMAPSLGAAAIAIAEAFGKNALKARGAMNGCYVDMSMGSNDVTKLMVENALKQGHSTDEVARRYGLTAESVKKYSQDTSAELVASEKNWSIYDVNLGETFENIKTGASEKFDAAKEAITKAWEDTKKNSETTWNTTKSNLGTTWDNLKNDASTKFDNAKKTILQHWEETKKNSESTWNNTKNNLGITWEDVKRDAGAKFEGAKKSIMQHWEETKKNTDTTWNNVKTSLGTTWNNVKSDASTKFTNVKTSILGSWKDVNSNTNSTWGGIKTFMKDSTNYILDLAKGMSAPFVSLWEGMANGVTRAFQGVVNGVKKPMNAVVSAVNAAIRAINKIQINIPDWVPGIGGSSLGFNIAEIPHFANGGIVGRDTLARIGEGNKREAVIPLENGGAMAPFADAVAERIASKDRSTVSSTSVGQAPIILQVGTLVADDRGITELKRRLDVIEIQERRRRG